MDNSEKNKAKQELMVLKLSEYTIYSLIQKSLELQLILIYI